MKTKLFLLVIFVVSINLAYSQKTVVEGYALTYAEDTLKIYTWDDLITKIPKQLSATKVRQDGYFKFEFDLSETIPVFISLNVFRGILFIEPQKTYEILLPVKTLKSNEDILNPFFQESDYFLKVITNDSSELNNTILKFEKIYQDKIKELFKRSQKKYSKQKTDSIIETIEKCFTDYSNEYFKDYKKFKFLSLKLIAYQRNIGEVIKQNFTNQIVKYNNISYFEYFTDIFGNFFLQTHNYLPDNMILESIQNKSITNLRKALQTHTGFINDEFCDLVIIQGVIDGFYNSSIQKENALTILDSISITSPSMVHRKIITNFRNTATKLLPGYTVPAFSLPNQNSKEVSIFNFSGKFVYLSFFNQKSYTCQQELSLLKKLYQLKLEDFEMVTIFVEENFESFKKFILTNPDCKWHCLFVNENASVLKDFQIRAYPCYFLISPDGKLTMLPAPSPAENIEEKYITIYRNWKKDQIRKQSQNKTLGID